MVNIKKRCGVFFRTAIYAQQKGQALTEMIFVLPSFFALVSGVIVVFQLQMASYTNDNAVNTLAYDDAGFERTMRTKWHWAESESASTLSATRLDAALNASQFFSQSGNMTAGVYNDKVYVKKENALRLAQGSGCGGTHAPAYTTTFKTSSALGYGSPQVQLSTCNPFTGYESSKAQLSFSDPSRSVGGAQANVLDMITPYLGRSQTRSSHSVFYPALNSENTSFSFGGTSVFSGASTPQDFSSSDIKKALEIVSWTGRAYGVHYAWLAAPLSSSGGTYARTYASALSGMDTVSQFNGKCLFSPITQGADCQSETYIREKFSRMAAASADQQMVLCEAEIIVSCSSKPDCITLKTVDFGVRVYRGEEPDVCSNTNALIKTAYKAERANLDGILALWAKDQAVAFAAAWKTMP